MANSINKNTKNLIFNKQLLIFMVFPSNELNSRFLKEVLFYASISNV